MKNGAWNILALIVIIIGIHVVVSKDVWKTEVVYDLINECSTSFNATKMECHNKKCKEGNRPCWEKNKCCYVESCQDRLCVPKDNEYGNRMELTHGES